ncbi:MAG: hypothetical protein ABIW76_24310 [Fibrobacteria bacterium]
MSHETKTTNRSPSHPEKALRRPGILVALAIASAALAAFAADPGSDAHRVKADSLKTLDVMITVELQSGNRVLRLKQPEGVDSLKRAGTGIRRDRFDRMVGDTGVAREMRTLEEFRSYWSKLEERNGFKSMKGQYAAQDIDRTLVPKVYLFDSAVVVFPGWVVLRKKAKR